MVFRIFLFVTLNLMMNKVHAFTELSNEEICEMPVKTTLIADEEFIDITKPSPESGIPAADKSGKKDSYHSFLAAAKYFSNSKTKRVLILPQGTYKIDKYIGGAEKGIQSIVYENASHFKIISCNARITVKGDFTRTRGRELGSMPGRFSPIESAVIPFKFVNCHDFGLYGVGNKHSGHGLELNGNVNLMSRDAKTIEGGGHGIATAGSTNYEISNVYIHHFSGDGILIGSGVKLQPVIKRDGQYTKVQIDQNLKITNLKVSNNARQGITIGQARKVLISDSSFNNSGRTGLGQTTNPNFPGYSPQAGMDIEPNHMSKPSCYLNCTSGVPRYLYAEKATGDIRVINSKFIDNKGSQIVSGIGEVSRVHFINPEIKATYGKKDISNSSRYVIWLEVNHAYIQGGSIETGLGAIFASTKKDAKTYILNTKITTYGSGILSIGNGVLRVLNTEIEKKLSAQSAQDGSIKGYMPYIRNTNPRSMIMNNKFSYKKEGHEDSFLGAMDRSALGLIQNGCLTDDDRKVRIAGNSYATDLTTSKVFTIGFSKSGVRHERFPQSEILRPFEKGEMVNKTFFLECK